MTKFPWVRPYCQEMSCSFLATWPQTETRKESVLCRHVMALRKRQCELEEKPAHVKVLFNDRECYSFHREQALVTLRPVVQVVDGVPILSEATPE